MQGLGEFPQLCWGGWHTSDCCCQNSSCSFLLLLSLWIHTFPIPSLPSFGVWGSREDKHVLSRALGSRKHLYQWLANRNELRTEVSKFSFCGGVVQLPSHVWLFATPWTAACQASLSLTISWSLSKFMSVVFSDAIQPSHLLMPSSSPLLSYTMTFPYIWTEWIKLGEDFQMFWEEGF